MQGCKLHSKAWWVVLYFIIQVKKQPAGCAEVHWDLNLSLSCFEHCDVLGRPKELIDFTVYSLCCKKVSLLITIKQTNPFRRRWGGCKLPKFSTGELCCVKAAIPVLPSAKPPQPLVCSASCWSAAEVPELFLLTEVCTSALLRCFLSIKRTRFLGLSVFGLTNQLWEVLPYKLEQSHILNAFPLFARINYLLSSVAGFLSVLWKLGMFLHPLGSEIIPVPHLYRLQCNLSLLDRKTEIHGMRQKSCFLYSSLNVFISWRSRLQ